MGGINYIDLFSGIGGFALGAYWAKMKFKNHFYSEIDKYCIELYNKRFPDSISLGDLTKINFEELKKYGSEWIITAGFPCQDISIAGKGKGITGSRSGLWFEAWGIIRSLRPRFAIIENVPAITFRGLDRILSGLAEIGYNAEWQNISAGEMGAPHKRERIWIIAYTNKSSNKQQIKNSGVKEKKLVFQKQSFRKFKQELLNNGLDSISQGKSSANTDYLNVQRGIGSNNVQKEWKINGTGSIGLQNTFPENARLKYGEMWGKIAESLQGLYPEWNSCCQFERPGKTRIKNKAGAGITGMDDGVSSRVDRLKGCGNAIVPHIALLLFECIKLNLKLMPNPDVL